MKSLNISKIHKNILIKLKEFNDSDKVETIYKKYRENIVLFDNEKIYFSDFFTLFNISEFNNFELLIKQIVFKNLLKKIKKVSLKKSCHKFLKDKDILKYILKSSEEISEKEILDKIKMNIISQDDISYESDFFDKLKSALTENVITLESINRNIESHNLNKREKIKLEEIEKNVYLLNGNQSLAVLLRNITPVKYCINSKLSYFLSYTNNVPYSIIYDFNEGVSVENSLFFVMPTLEVNGKISLEIYNRNNKEVKTVSEIKYINHILLKNHDNIEIFYIEGLKNLYSYKNVKDLKTKIRIAAYLLSECYFSFSKETYDCYYEEFKKNKEFDKLELEMARAYKKRYEWTLNNFDNILFNSDNIEILAKKIKSLNLTIMEKREVISLLDSLYESSMDEDILIKAKNIRKMLLSLVDDADFEIILKDILSSDITCTVYYHSLSFLNQIDFLNSLDKYEKEIFTQALSLKIREYRNINDALLALDYLKENKIMEDEIDNIIFYLMDSNDKKDILILNEYLSELGKESILLKTKGTISSTDVSIDDFYFLENDSDKEDDISFEKAYLIKPSIKESFSNISKTKIRSNKPEEVRVHNTIRTNLIEDIN